MNPPSPQPQKSRAKFIRVFLTVIIGVGLFFALTIYPRARYIRSIIPPEHLPFTEIDETQFTLYKTNETHFAVVPQNYAKTIWFRLTVPSGHPIYIYDDQGNLMDWTGDAGNHPAFHKKWDSLLKTDLF